ncbi:MAG: molybdopterin biosynthesis protein [Planctomycetes bacterium]|nr:molybdopterin biosynthesis protein [Planctomycetota bacterium]
MTHQDQFLDVIDRDEAERRFQGALSLDPLPTEPIPIAQALGRVLAESIVATVDVPGFDRSNVDGFAVRSADTIGADEERPLRLRLLPTQIDTGQIPQCEVTAGTSVAIATGGMLPRGADAVVMVEHTDTEGETLLVRKSVAGGAGLTFAGTDIAAGETVLHAGRVLTSRETGVLAAVGRNTVQVHRRPRVAILSTGNELIAPGEAMRPGLVYDSNQQILADAVRELGGEPVSLGIVGDNVEQLRKHLRIALDSADLVLLSGGTSKGQGDLSYRVVAELTDPGIVAHGVALKPGKPICLAATGGRGVVILPGFPTSAIFTFHEFVAPVIRRLAGLPTAAKATVAARLAVKVNSEIGRTEYLLVGLVEQQSISHAPREDQHHAERDGYYVAYPMGKGSGSVTTFSQADGFVTIGRHVEIVPAGATVEVQLLSRELRIADLVVIGSHCVGLDYLLGLLEQQGITTRFLAVGSTTGLAAAERGECDIAGIHLLDPKTGEYNRPFLKPGLSLIRGYARKQGIVFRRGDDRFEGRTATEAVAAACDDPACTMVNRNQGSGTRILIDQLLAGRHPAGYAVQARSHNAVAAAVVQGRADWGVAISSVAESAELDFLPYKDEQYDFMVPDSRRQRPAVKAFERLLAEPTIREELSVRGLRME